MVLVSAVFRGARKHVWSVGGLWGVMFVASGSVQYVVFVGYGGIQYVVCGGCVGSCMVCE